MLRTLMAGVAAISALLPTQTYAQTNSEVTLFSRGHFEGARYTITEPTQFQVPFVMKSVVIPAGSVWEFCSGSTYSGCRQLSQSVPATVMTVRSVRPVATILPASATPSGGTLSGQSLRGMASEYFVAPDEGGNRVDVQPGTTEAMSLRASEFCRSHKWRSSAYARLQSIGGRFYLADVLCSDTGG